MMTRKQWRQRSFNLDLAREICGKLQVPLAIAAFMVQRGVDCIEQAHSYLEPHLDSLPDPFTMKGMDQAVALLADAVIDGKNILIYGDYDADGITATAVLFLFLQEIGGQAHGFQPDRIQDGYGLNLVALQKLHHQLGLQEEDILLTVDCGISNSKEIEQARALGLTTIVTDHHQPGAELPPADAVINPLQPGCLFPDKSLAGVGVAFFVTMALRRHLGERGYFASTSMPNLKRYLDLVAIGTVADLVPLQGVNRILTRVGLQVLNSTGRQGLISLLQVSQLHDSEITAADISYRLGPRINAAGRLGDAKRAFQLLITDDSQQAMQLAAELDEENSARREIENELYEAVLPQAEAAVKKGRSSLVFCNRSWHQGILGIVASRLMRQHYRPVILLTEQDGILKGSGRAIPALDLYQALESCRELLERFGGHKNAAGLALVPVKLDEFIEKFEEACRQQLAADDLVPRVTIDWQIEDSAMLDRSFLGWYRKLEPFGKANSEPLFAMKKPVMLAKPKIVGQGHLKFILRDNGKSFTGIGFNHGHMLDAVNRDPVNLAFHLRLNTFQGREAWEVTAEDISPPATP